MAASRLWQHVERIWDVISSWGGPEAVQITPSTAEPRETEIRVVLAQGVKRIHVGTLRLEGGEYVFEYSPPFKDEPGLQPISAFRELSRTYRSPKLWPFFSVRIPPLSREDVQRVIAQRGIDPDDQLALLEAVGGKTITSPYELQLVRPDRRSQVPSNKHVLAHQG